LLLIVRRLQGPICLFLIWGTFAAGIGRSEDFRIMLNGKGPILVHTELSYAGKGEHLAATATNESPNPIAHAKLCVTNSSYNGCLFSIWNTGEWAPGAELHWDSTAARRIPDLSHEVTIVELDLVGKDGTILPNAPVPLPPEFSRWRENAPDSDAFYVDGLRIETLQVNGIEVRAAVSDADSYMRVDLVVVNRTPNRVDVIPEKTYLQIFQPRFKELAYKSPDQLSTSIRHRAAWASILAAMGSFRTKTITSTTYGSGSVDIVGAGGLATGTYSGSATTTTTMPDEAARAQSAAQIAAIEQRKEAAMQAVHDITLRSNTLFSGQQISGAMFFEREKNHTSMVLSVPLAGRTFQFVF
jgi:hypothetical protein